VALLRELTEQTRLAEGWTGVLLDTYKTFPSAHLPGRVLADLAVVIADGGGACGSSGAGSGGGRRSGLFGWAGHRHRRSRLRTRRRRTRPRRGRRPSASIRCWPTWTARTCPAAKGWPGSCGQAMPGPNTTADHVQILGMALAALPGTARPRPGEADSPQRLIRTDAAGVTHPKIINPGNLINSRPRERSRLGRD